MAHTFDPKHADRLDHPDRWQSQPPDAILALLDLKGDETVIDFGAGTGAFTLPVAEALPHGQVLAVDISAELLERLRSKLSPELAERVETLHTTADHVPLPDAVADAVLTVNVLHEVAHHPAVLSEIRRLLKPAGRFVVVDWAPGERPGGPRDVLRLEQAVDLLTARGFKVTQTTAPGQTFPYHYAIVARPTS